MRPEIFTWDKSNNSILDNDFIKKLEFDGVKSIVGDKGYITLKKEENIYLIQLSEYISLSLLEESFLAKLTYEDLKNTYINTEPIFSRPRLMFDEARLTNIPINLNLSKEDLLLYISQIKEDYDKNKNIVKTDIEYIFDLTLESDLVQMPTHIKYAREKRTSKDKKLLPVKRHDFKRSFASAFYIYDLYKLFLRFFKIKRRCIRRERRIEIKKIKATAKREGVNIDINLVKEEKKKASEKIKDYQNNNLITQISYLINDLSEDQVDYYLTTMKEFIHGVNQKGEYARLKKRYNHEEEGSPEPKYKNLIIGDSYIIKSNKPDLIENLLG